ncbi:UNVERIFIED_CONTAM: hypothetical protein Sradi_3122900 [Sesamum radiatum]|uniref:DUF569 domain-containing protein n=1 Tax=Sesamum radiatum TaxID=300843 RepID=A0AAW2RDR1_SESRA
MDLFRKAKTVRLISHKDKYLVAEEDCLTVSQDRDGSTKNAVWTVEFVEGKNCIRLLSCYGTYLTASSIPFLPGVTGKKVIQTWSSQCHSGAEWEPLRDGMQVRLRSQWGNFLRPNGGLPPWRNSVTHDVPHRSKTYEKVLWGVEVVEKCTDHPFMEEYGSTFNRSRSASALMDPQNQSDNIRRVLLSNELESFSNVKWCLYRKACIPFPR